VVYSRNVGGQVYTFGVSGRLYKSNVLIYDHQTESLWSQLMQKAVSGDLAGKKLSALPSSRMKWAAWRKKHPQTVVLSTATGYHRNYATDPYEGYYRIGSLMFPVGNVRQDLSLKKRVLGIEINNESRAYPLDELGIRAGVHNDRLGGQDIRIEVDAEGQVIAVKDHKGQAVPHLFAYWFAWQAFHPQTSVYRTVN
jgi:hypothetical protein